jgi:hypothetical protein
MISPCFENGISGNCGPDCPAWGSEEECPERDPTCKICGEILTSDDEKNLGICLGCSIRIDSDCKIIAEKWKELDEYYQIEIEKIIEKHHIQVWDADEGVSIGFFFKGRYLWANVDWSGDVGDFQVTGSVSDLYSDLQSRVYEIAGGIEKIGSHVIDEIEKTCESIGYDVDWEDTSCFYRKDDIQLSSSSYETDWTCFEVEGE